MSPLVIIGIVLLVLWGVLWLGFNIVSGIVHLLVIAAIVMIAWGLLKRGASAVSHKL
jgi:Flp pilus assembly protein TadB